MTFNESNVIRDHGRFAGVRHRDAPGGTAVLSYGDVQCVSLSNFADADLDKASFPNGATAHGTRGEQGFVVGEADSYGRFSWNGDDSGRDWLRLHQMHFRRDDRPGAAAYAKNLEYVGSDFNRDPEDNCIHVMEAGRQFYRSVDAASLDRDAYDAYERLGWDVEGTAAPNLESCRRILESANDLVGGMYGSSSGW